MKNTLSRRRVLRGMFQGTAIAVALPRLEMMLNNNGNAWAQTGSPVPSRFGVWAKANGVHFARWVPQSTGKGYQLTPQLMPLAPVKEHFSILTGLNIPRIGANPARGHSAMNTILMTGVGMTGGDQTYTAAAKSIDQIVAELLPATPRKSLHLGVASGPGQEPGTAFHWWSHNGPNSPNMANYNCKEVFDLLFTGAKLPEPGKPMQPAGNVVDGTLKSKQSVLDYCKQDADDLLKVVGSNDQKRLKQHLEGIFEIEQRLKSATAAGMEAGVIGSNGQPIASSSCSTPVAPSMALVGGSGDYNDNVRLINKTMAQLLAIALACDITRVFTFETMQPGSRVNVRTITGRDSAYHGMSHGNAGDENCHKVQLAMMDELRIFIEIFRDTQDGAGSLLDSTAILATDDTNQGPDHGLNNFPMLIIGKAGGLRLGEHIRFNNENAIKVPLTLARAAGAKMDKFGGAEGVTDSLSALLTS